MSNTLYEALNEYKRWLYDALLYVHKITPETFFFYSSRLEPAHSTFGSYVVKKFCKKYEIQNLSAHIFRHTYASVLIAEKVPVTTVAEFLGDTPKTVLNTYAHSIKQQEIKAIDIFDKIINPDDKLEKID